MQNKYRPHYLPVSEDAKALVALVSEELDQRKAVFKNADPEELQAIVCSFLVFGKHNFDFVANDLPKAQRPLAKAVYDALLGKWLKRVSGKNTVRLENNSPHHNLTFRTKGQEGDIRIQTKTGVVCRDFSYEFFERDLISHVRYCQAEFVTLHAVNHHLHILEGLAEPPSRRWFELDELQEPFQTPERTWEEVRDYLVQQVRLRGGYIAPYGNTSFICPSAEQSLKQIDLALLRMTGRRFTMLATIRNRYGREHSRPGSIV